MMSITRRVPHARAGRGRDRDRGTSKTAAIRPLLLLALVSSTSSVADATSIDFTQVPAWMTHENLEGIVQDASPAAWAVAVYICVGGAWWTKPTFEEPLTPIAPDGTWWCDVTTGGADTVATQYAAFVVPLEWAAYLADGVGALPESLFSSPHVHTIRHPGSRTIEFSGYDWVVKRCDAPWGPGPNYFSDSEEDVWVDPQGALHVRIVSRDDRWYCAEVILVDSLGYGQYECAIQSRLDSLDANAVLGLFTWDEACPQAAHREIDIEFSRWGEIESDNAQYVVQPSENPGNLHRFSMAARDSTRHRFRWCGDRVVFESLCGNQLLHSWEYLGGDTPLPGRETFRLNFWLCGGTPPVGGLNLEAVIDRFEFRPVDDDCHVVTCRDDTLDVPDPPALRREHDP